jgi:hypothetical protein
MTGRRSNKIARIQCAASAVTVNRIAQSRGLIAQPSEQPNEHFLVDSGRNLASEVEPDLLQATLVAMSEAERIGLIPPYTLVSRKRSWD